MGHQAYAIFDGMTWPAVGKRLGDLEYKLRYHPGTLTRKDEMVCASVLSAYRAMVFRTQKSRNAICTRLKAEILSDSSD